MTDVSVKMKDGVIIYKMTPEECESSDVNILPDLVFDRYDGERFMSVIDPRGLAKKLKVDIEGCEDDFNNAFCSAVFDQICANRDLQFGREFYDCRM